jgi:hypothetical protein
LRRLLYHYYQIQWEKVTDLFEIVSEFCNAKWEWSKEEDAANTCFGSALKVCKASNTFFAGQTMIGWW